MKTPTSLDDDLGLGAACSHGHWRLVQFLLENAADPNRSAEDTGKSPLHSVLCTTDRVAHDRVLRVLLSFGANPNCTTNVDIETGGFMRDTRTRGETPLHRAAAFGSTATIQLLLDAGARIDARDADGDSPLSWANWRLRPTPILRLLCFGDFHVRPDRQDMRANLLGDPQQPT